MDEPRPEDWIERVETAERRGELFRAADHAETGLDDLGDEMSDAERERLEYLLVRTLSRSGATDRAAELYERYGIGARNDADCQALGGRILKDQALRSPDDQRAKKLCAAAAAYSRVHDRFGGSYGAVNAATLYLLAGDTDAAANAARAARAACETETKGYWREATLGEAAIVLGETDAARNALAEAGRLIDERNYADRASTLRQLGLLCAATGCDRSILDEIAVPDVVMFAGHIIAAPGQPGRFPADQEEAVRREIAAFFDDHHIGVAFGSLAAGADLLIAEECLRRDIDLYAVLPFEKSDFIAASVAPAGDTWARRFEACHDAALGLADHDRGGVIYATDGAHLGDDSLFGYCAEYAMGLALVRARHLAATPRMLAVYDGRGGGGFGTDSNIAQWQRFGFPLDIVPVDGNHKPGGGRGVRTDDTPRRIPHGMLFGDIKGFSGLREEALPVFHGEVMARLSVVLDRCGDALLYRNSWGDAIYAVFADARSAAACGLALQAEMAAIDYRALGLGDRLHLRLGGHYGPVFEGTDFIRREPTYFGSHVTRAARIEPITPAGELYVTEQMAAALALDADREIECDYMGVLGSAKGYGDMRMYHVHRRASQ